MEKKTEQILKKICGKDYDLIFMEEKKKLNPAKLIIHKSGPIASVRACPFCDFRIIVPKGRPGVGRGYGMREGNKARGKMIQHIKDHLKERNSR